MLNTKYTLLVNQLRGLVEKYSNNTKIKNVLAEEFEKRNLLASKATNILTGKIKLEELNIEDDNSLFILFAFVSALQKALSTIDEVSGQTLGTIEEYSNLEVGNYFTNIEVENLKDFKIEKKQKSSFPYVFHNMLKAEEGHWTGITSAQMLAEIDAANDISYNFATQRDPKINVFGFKQINIDTKKIETIKRRMLDGLQRPDEIKLNVLRGSGDGVEVEFISKDGIIGDLIIHSGEIDIFDGYHRKTASSMAVKENPEIKFNWKIAITNLSEKAAQDYMVQINEQKLIAKEHTKNMDSSLLGNIVVDDIKDNRKSEFALYIKDSDAELKISGLTKKSILAMAIDENYREQLKTRINIAPIANWIVEFTNYLMGIYIDEFIARIEDTKKFSYINHKNMFYGYIALSAELYNNSDWQSKLKDKMSKIDFGINNEYWKQIKIEDDLSKVSRKDIYKLFREGI